MSARAKPAKFIVFDSFAVIALLEKQIGWELVRQTLRDLASAHRMGIISLMNWGEVYYTAVQRNGLELARNGMKSLDRLPLSIAPVDRELTVAAAEIKGQWALSYADAFCIATARRLNARVITGDPEFKYAEDLVDIIWLPQRHKSR